MLKQNKSTLNTKRIKEYLGMLFNDMHLEYHTTTE